MSSSMTGGLPDAAYLRGLEALARRLVMPRTAAGTPLDASLLVGALPPDLPFSLPRIQETTVIGSVVTAVRTTIYLTVALDASQVEAAYAAHLEAEGWRGAGPNLQGGFIAGLSMTLRVFEHADNGTFLTLTIPAMREGQSEVELSLQSAPPPGFMQTFANVFNRDPFGLLVPPPQSEIRTGSLDSGVSPDGTSFFRQAWLTSELDLASISRHFHEQLEEGGWRFEELEEATRTMQSTWSRRTGDGVLYRGVFLAIQRLDISNEYYVHVHADRFEPANNACNHPR